MCLNNALLRGKSIECKYIQLLIILSIYSITVLSGFLGVSFSNANVNISAEVFVLILACYWPFLIKRDTNKILIFSTLILQIFITLMIEANSYFYLILATSFILAFFFIRRKLVLRIFQTSILILLIIISALSIMSGFFALDFAIRNEVWSKNIHGTNKYIVLFSVDNGAFGGGHILYLDKKVASTLNIRKKIWFNNRTEIPKVKVIGTNTINVKTKYTEIEIEI